MFEFLKKIFKKRKSNFLHTFLCSFFLSFFIFLILTGQFTKFDNQSLISSILIADLLIILLLIGQTSLKVLKFLKIKKKTTKSSKNLHTQITLLITVIALIPSLMVTLSSIIFFDQGKKLV